MDQTITIGTLIHGTLQDRDLLPAFADELERVSSGAYVELIAEARQLIETGFTDGETSAEAVNDLQDALTEYAPPHMYFGNTSDGSDFGWWADIDSMDGCESRILDDHNAIDLDCQLHVNVNDHGNVTVSKLVGEVLWTLV